MAALLKLSQLERSEAQSDQQQRALIRGYFFDGCSLEELHALGLLRNLNNAEDRVEILSIIFLCKMLVSMEIPEAPARRTHRLCLLLNQAENIECYSYSKRQTLLKGLNTLVEKTEAGFTLWLNMSNEAMAPEAQTLLGKQFLSECITHNLLPHSNGS